MSTLKVEILKIDNILKHSNADRLVICEILGWNCVTQKGKYSVGDKIIYFPIDSVLTEEVQNKIFPPDSKVKLTKGRIRTIRLRGAISQGLVVDPKLFGLEGEKVGSDVTKKLSVIKYEPPQPKFQTSGTNVRTSKKNKNSNFKKYTDIRNYKNHPDLFTKDNDVCVTEKGHGTNFRCGYAKNEKNTLWKKILGLFGLLKNSEFVLGSHNVQLQGSLGYKGFYKKNVYAEMAKKYDLENLLKPNEVIYSEIFGDGIQGGYTYGCKREERKLAVFDVMIDGKYLDVDDQRAFCIERGLPIVPELYRGKFDIKKIKKLTKGNSVLAPTQKVREGVVIKSLKEQRSTVGRKILKLISDEYLLNKNNTDFH